MGKYKILIVEDEKDISDGVKLFLSHMGYDIMQAFNGKDAIRYFNSFKPHVILLDTLLPDIRGTELCSEFSSDNVGIIFLTALSAKNNIVEGFKCGADDYIPKPFDLDILLARIEALINRLDINTEDKNGLLFDMFKNDVFIAGNKLFLTKMEFRVFHCLYSSSDYISADQILRSIDESFSSGVSTRTVSVHIANIRKKLFEAGFYNMEIISKYSVGYKIEYL